MNYCWTRAALHSRLESPFCLQARSATPSASVSSLHPTSLRRSWVGCRLAVADSHFDLRQQRRTQFSLYVLIAMTDFPVDSPSVAACSEAFLLNQATCLSLVGSCLVNAPVLRAASNCSPSIWPKSSISLPTSPVQPVWWLAPRPAPLSPWKY